MKTSGLFYREKPLFGFDIGYTSIKVVEIDRSNKKLKLQAFGTSNFNPAAIKQGEIVDFQELVSATKQLMEHNLQGHITTDRVAASLPVLHSFTRIINLPLMNDKDVVDAIKLEAEQYIPIAISDLYLDYKLLEKTPKGQDYLVSAAPKKIVDSYIKLFDQLHLEMVAMEPSILSVSRAVENNEDLTTPTLVIDFGSITTDLIIYKDSAVRVTGTIKFGGDIITQALAHKFNLSLEEALSMKKRFGLDLSERQTEIVSALAQPFSFLTSEIKKIIRYFEERDKDQTIKIEQIIILGGGANMPGFSTFLTSELRIPTRLIGVWHNIDKGHLNLPGGGEASTYATAAGLSLIKPREIVS